MPVLDLGTHRLHYRVDGQDSTAPWLVFCNSLGTDLHMWDAQVEPLGRRFRLLRYDRRGHGRSSVPPGPYVLADLGRDVIALLDALGIARAHFCGLSIGGLTGQWLGLHAAERFDRMIFCATAPRIGTEAGWQDRVRAVQADGLPAMAEATADRWFSPGFRAAAPEVVDRIIGTFAATPPMGYAGCCAALAGADLRGDIARIARPVLALSGAEDAVCPPDHLDSLARTVRDGRHVTLPGRHIVNVEAATEFSDHVMAFLA